MSERARQWPNQWARLADPRTPEACKLALCDDVHRRPRCCVGAFGKDLAAKSERPDALLSPPWRMRCLAWARLVSRGMSIADVERAHHITKSLVTGTQKSMPNLTAQQVLHGSRHQLQASINLASSCEGLLQEACLQHLKYSFLTSSFQAKFDGCPAHPCLLAVSM